MHFKALCLYPFFCLSRFPLKHFLLLLVLNKGSISMDSQFHEYSMTKKGLEFPM